MKSEWKHLYPLYKGMLVIVTAILMLLSIRVIAVFNRWHDVSDYIFVAGVIGVTIFFMYRIWMVFKIPYKSVPGISNLMDKKRLIHLIEKEDFKRSQNLKTGLLYDKVFISDEWIRICDYYIPIHLITMIWLEEQGLGIQHFYVKFCLLTGDVVSIKYLIRDTALKKDLPFEYTNAGVKKTLMEVLKEHTKALDMQPYVGRRGGMKLKELIKLVTKWGAENEVKQHIEMFIHGSSIGQEEIEKLSKTIQKD